MARLLSVLVAGAVCLCGMNPALAAPASAGADGRNGAVMARTKTERNAPPLKPGAAAGIRPAQGSSETIWHIIGIGFIAGVGLAMIIDHFDKNDSAAPATSGS